jgi:hypothetical protein
MITTQIHRLIRYQTSLSVRQYNEIKQEPRTYPNRRYNDTTIRRYVDKDTTTQRANVLTTQRYQEYDPTKLGQIQR